MQMTFRRVVSASCVHIQYKSYACGSFQKFSRKSQLAMVWGMRLYSIIKLKLISFKNRSMSIIVIDGEPISYEFRQQEQ
jgi:hypothetical protein